MLKPDTDNFPIRVRQYAILHGGVQNCRNDRYPGIYTLVSNPHVLSFINLEVYGEGMAFTCVPEPVMRLTNCNKDESGLF